MKSKQQKRDEAIARNADKRGKYLDQATKLGLEGADRETFADHRQGIPKKHEHVRSNVVLDD